MRKIIIFSLLLSMVTLNVFANCDNCVEHLRNSEEQICSPAKCYTIVKKLGEGAFGKVYKVEDEQGSNFAIKSYKQTDSSYVYTDAEREFSRGQFLSHPNIIKSHDLFMTTRWDETNANIVLDLVEGKTLSASENGDFPNQTLVKAATQFTDALRYALTQKMMHLDLHGGNIMLDNDANIMVIDLASFFTFDELYNAYQQYSSDFDYYTYQTYTNYYLDSNDYTNETDGSSRMEMLMANKLEAKDDDRVIMDKLKKILFDNPDLLARLKQAEEKMRNEDAADRFNLVSMSSAVLGNDNNGPIELSSSIVVDPSPVHAYYFKHIVSICTELIEKSHLPREEKIELLGQIAKISWNYDEDINEGNNPPVNKYMLQLLQTLQSH